MNNLAYLKKYRRIYLASPYTLYGGGIDKAYDDIRAVATVLAAEDIDLFCPIIHWHPIATAKGSRINPTDAPFFLKFNMSQQDDADALVIAQLVGWDNSDGIKGEFAHAMLRTQPIHYLDPERMVLTR